MIVTLYKSTGINNANAVRLTPAVRIIYFAGCEPIVQMGSFFVEGALLDSMSDGDVTSLSYMLGRISDVDHRVARLHQIVCDYIKEQGVSPTINEVEDARIAASHVVKATVAGGLRIDNDETTALANSIVVLTSQLVNLFNTRTQT